MGRPEGRRRWERFRASGNYTAPAALPNPNALTDYGDERGCDFGERVECGDDFESDADAVRDESGEHGHRKLFDHADRHEFYFRRAGDAGQYAADDDVCLGDATDGERKRIDFGRVFGDGGESRSGQQQLEQRELSDWRVAAGFGLQPDVDSGGRELERVCSLLAGERMESGYFYGGGRFQFDGDYQFHWRLDRAASRISARDNIRDRRSGFRTRSRMRSSRRFR